MENQFKGKTTAGRVLARVFWVSEGILLVEMFNISTTINSEQYAVMKKVKTTKLTGLAKQENE